MTTSQEAAAAQLFLDEAALEKRRRRNRIRHEAVQIGIIVAVTALAALFALAVKNGLARHGIRFSFSFLWNVAGFDISEGKTLAFDNGAWPSLTDFTADRSIAQAFVTGLANTVKISILAIVFSTVLGTALGIGRLSTNWLVRNISFWVVEFVRNTPLLIQLVFWYFAVILRFPPLASAAKLYGGFIISRQSIYLPTIVWQEGASGGSILMLAVAVALACAAIAVRQPKVRWTLAAAAAALFLLMQAYGAPISLDYPVASRFQATGGTSMSPEMAAILLAIVVNSGAYIAEIVRGAIEALPKGQWEAAVSLGMSRRTTIHDIILPQAFRVVLPSFGNQYISLTKNTALGIAIGYPELFNIYGTIANQTGHSLEGIVIVMLSYLLLSWIISAVVSFVDGRLTKQGAMR